jgi:two-component system, NtrC family, sensor histidine kinase KinB
MLRTRLLLYLLPFPLILLAIGAYAVLLFVRLARELDRVVTMNYQSVMAAQDMTLSLARMQSAVRLGIDSSPEEAGIAFQRHAARFEEQLDRQRQSIGSAEVRALTGEIAQAFRALHASGATTLAEDSRSDRRRDYEQVFYPASLGIQLLLDELGQSGRRSILVANESAEHLLRQVTVLMVAAILVGLTLAGYSGYQFARSILTPIQSLTRATRELGKGATTPPVVVKSRDELAALAAAFNDMAAQLQEFRRSTSAEILKLHRTMQATLASFPDPVYVLSPEGAIELENPSAQALSRSLTTRGGLPPALDALVETARKSGVPHLPNDFKEVICVRHDAQERFYLPRILAMRDENGEQVGVAAVLYDLTRFRLLDAMKTNLVATVSHELKTPLTGVRMALHLLLEESLGPLTPRQQDMVATARDDAERLLRILNDLLDLARLDEGGAALRREPMPAEQFFHETVAELAETVSAAGLALISKADSNLPRILVDIPRIRHVFDNLLSNAIKQSPVGGRIVMRTTLNADGNVEFSVHDDGPGIAPEFHARIFERFFRVPGQAKGGVGLGLSIAREIVLAHGGYLGVRSQPAQGSEFYFTLPPIVLAAPAADTP